MQTARYTTLKLLAATLFALGLIPAQAADQWQFDGVSQVVAVADIHGAFKAMTATLENAGVVDSEFAWAAGTAHLVIVGDILDRGAGSRAAMDLLMRLESEAEAAGGRVHVLIGNHEVMNLVGDLRYVARGEFGAYASDETAELRDQAFAAWSASRLPELAEGEDARSVFDDRFPPGFFAHREAFAADGKYGGWLLSKPIIVVINGTAFVHGGVAPMTGELGLEGVNGQLADELEAYVRQLGVLEAAGILLPGDDFYAHDDLLTAFLPGLDTPPEVLDAIKAVVELSDSDIHSPDGPLWYRGNVGCSRLIEEDRLLAALDRIGAKRVVIGHTPTRTRTVLSRLDGRIVEIDTGMNRARYKGSGNALLIKGDSLAVVNEAGPERLQPLPHPRQVGNRPGGFLSSVDLETLLATGELEPAREDEAGRRIVRVSDGRRSVEAVFDPRASRGFYPELAAYRLDQLLDLRMVPVVVRREFDGKDGTLRFLPPQLVDENARSSRNLGGGAMCPISDQWLAMYIFDSLIYNEGRDFSRMQYSTDNWQLVLVDHQRAFSTRKGKPRHLEQLQLPVNDSWRRALSAASDEVLDQALADALDKRRLKALKTRRDEMLAQ